MSQEQVNLDVTIDDKDMFDFNLYHTYHSKNGWLAIIFGVAAVVAAFVTYGRVTRAYTTIYVMIGFVMLIYEPFAVYSNSKRQMKLSEVLQNVLHYAINSEGVMVTTDVEMEDGQNSVLLPWKQVYKVVHTKKALYIFSNNVNAYIIPNRYTEDNWNALEKIIVRNVDDFRRKL
jgi:hypothetical protein